MRDYLEQLAGSQQIEAEVAAFERSARSTPGAKGWRFDRYEADRLRSFLDTNVLAMPMRVTSR